MFTHSVIDEVIARLCHAKIHVNLYIFLCRISGFCQMAASILRTNFILREDKLQAARIHMATGMKKKGHEHHPVVKEACFCL